MSDNLKNLIELAKSSHMAIGVYPRKKQVCINGYRYYSFKTKAETEALESYLFNALLPR